MIYPRRKAGQLAQSNTRRKLVTAFVLCAALPVTFAAGAAPAPIKLAMFDFELEDFSAGASSTGTTASDATQLTDVNEKVRQLFAQSGRYTLVDVGSVDAPAAKTHTLRECDGCDAGIALKLGAEQSFVGVV